MNEKKFDPNKFASFKLKTKENLLNILKGVKENKKTTAQKQPQNPISFFAILLVLLFLITAAFLIRVFLFQAYFVPSDSMSPVLRSGEIVVINKLFFPVPKRKDVYVISTDEIPGFYIKRVIGLPGEQVKIRKGNIYINGKLLSEHKNIIKDDSNYDPIRITRGNYFVLGDNRENSIDSRQWGPIPRNKFIGKIVYRIWPIKKMGEIR
jgi:signal peptidase I